MSRAEWILGGLLVVLLAVVGVLAIMLWFQPDPAAPPSVPVVRAAVVAPTPSYTGHTALAASALAQNRAQSWQSDAVLLKTSATWSQGAGRESIVTGSEAWNFTYYSPGQNAVVVISVVNNEAKLITERGDLENSVTPQQASGWKVDSPAAIQMMLNAGGGDFLAAEKITTLNMSLSTDTPERRIEWFISLFGEQTGRSFSVRIDANSGDVVEVIASP